MTRIRTADIDSYNEVQVHKALDLIISLTSSAGRVLPLLDIENRRAFWKHNNKAIRLAEKLCRLNDNLDNMGLR